LLRGLHYLFRKSVTLIQPILFLLLDHPRFFWTRSQSRNCYY
jgi:hypothetical protein